MVLRSIKRIGSFFLTLLLLFFISGCTVNIVDPLPRPNQSKSEQVNIVYQYLDKYYYESLPLDLSQIDSVEELLTYTDPYTLIYEAGSQSIERDESYEGLGITVTNHPLGLMITDINKEIVFENKIYVGDIIKHIDVNNLLDMEFEDKTNLLKGELGDLKEMVIVRLNKEIIVNLKIVEVPFDSIKYKAYDNTGYIKIVRFGKNTDKLFFNALEELENSNIDGLIIDVRDNGGGYLNVVLNIILNFITGEEPIMHLYDVKADEREALYPHSEAVKKDYPIIVLTNGSSASASEILAGAFQQFGYPTFGETTYGKDLFQSSVVLPEEVFGENKRLNFTRGYWYLNDDSVISEGIKPDIYFAESGLKTLLYPALLNEFKKGDSHPYIYVYQYLTSLVVEGNYSPNYFDHNFEEMLINYQSEKNLEETGRLDLNTLISLIDLYVSLIQDEAYDNTLKEALNYMDSFNNGN